MADGDGGKKRPGLRVDRLAEAMDAARARARGEARPPQPPRRAAGPEEKPQRDQPSEPLTPETPGPGTPAPETPGPETPAPPPQPARPDRPVPTPQTPPETPGPPPSPEETPTETPAAPPIPEEIPPRAPDEVPDADPGETRPSAPDEIAPPLPDELPSPDPDRDIPKAPDELPRRPAEVPDAPDEVLPGAPDEVPSQAPDELPGDRLPDRAAGAPKAVETALDAAPAEQGWPGWPTDDLRVSPAPKPAQADDSPDAPLPPLLLQTPAEAAAPAPRKPRDVVKQADRLSAAIRQETATVRTPAEPVAPATAAVRTGLHAPARAALGPPLLALDGLATDIGRYHILSDVGFDVPTGGVTMLLGRNGAGKTTTLRSIMGLWRPKAGRITLAGEDIAGWAAPRIARAGIGYVPEDMGIFGDLTVAENMRLAARSGRLRDDRLDWIFATFPALKTFWRSPAGVLSGGQKQMLSVARVMAEQRRLYLIDEPTKGLAPAIVATLVGALRDLKGQGASILLVEQNFAVARALGDMAVVMENGGVAWTGSMPDLAADTALQERLMGLRMEGAA